MNRLILSLILSVALGATSCKSDAKSTANTSQETATASISFGVRGNCSMCKETIETVALTVEGVSKASWSVDKKNIEVSFDTNTTNDIAIHNAIAASGYDTDKVSGNETAYKNLPNCCQYDRNMVMNQ